MFRVYLTITSTAPGATDPGYLLHNPKPSTRVSELAVGLGAGGAAAFEPRVVGSIFLLKR